MSRARRVLILVDSGAPLGGAEILTRTLRNALRDQGAEVRIFASSHGREHPENFADYFCFSATSRLQAASRSFNASAYFSLKRALDDFEPDVVHVRMFLFQLSPAILPLLTEYKSVYHADYLELICPSGLKMLPNGSNCTFSPGRPCLTNGCLSVPTWLAIMFSRRLLARWLPVFDAIVPASLCVRAALRDHGLNTAHVIPSCVPLTPARTRLAARPTIVCASRLVREKGVDVLIEAAAVAASRIAGMRLLIVGDGPERATLEARAKELGLSDAVAFIGMVPQERMSALFADAWVQAVPSKWIEPFGLVAAEAHMRGVAVVASNTGALPEIVVEGETGYLVAPGDPGALSDALVRVCSDRNLAERLGQAARVRGLAEFSPRTCAERFGELYDSLGPPSVAQAPVVLRKTE